MALTFERIAFSIERRAERLIYQLYKVYSYFKAKEIRKKEKIKVVFLLSELSVWKTERLYNLMRVHPRFTVYIAVFRSTEDRRAIEQLTTYLKKKRYEYIILNGYNTISNILSPDIIFYQKPYDGLYTRSLLFRYNINSLFCYVNYAFNTVAEKAIINLPLKNYAWKVFYESKQVLEEEKRYLANKCRNGVVTGLPISDEFILPLETYSAPWKCTDKKRIVWAPHHTIGDMHVPELAYSTFLDYSDFMLEMATKYSDKIQIAFKPHPSLREKLVVEWGEKRTTDYYSKWNNMENTQLETGSYVALFRYSDAIIHDCGSFTIEAHYARCPVMYLLHGNEHEANLNTFAKCAFNLHYKGYDKTDIENFIKNVIRNHDPLRKEREAFFKNKLLPPNRKLASENIINCILGVGNYK